MLKVVLTDFVLGDILEAVNNLRMQGYKQGVDFDFAYHPEKIDSNDFSYTIKENRRVEFMFYDEQLGLLFKLKNGQ